MGETGHIPETIEPSSSANLPREATVPSGRDLATVPGRSEVASSGDRARADSAIDVGAGANGGTQASRPHKQVRIRHSRRDPGAQLDAVIQLVDEWMADTSGYEEEHWEQLKVALDEGRPDWAKRFP